ncbi:MAG: arsenosugar biosynthesis radical SAM protein ArsS [Anaerolineae bacterium]|nr:arsenosugar biosynthesis radical SAM protein ArsS [Gloeobacterales cyanobacterium ES-bin-313]
MLVPAVTENHNGLPVRTFAEQVGTALHRERLETLQVSLGKYCNLACNHCHVEAGPKRTEIMDRATAEQIVVWLQENSVVNLDLTGGAPELNPEFRYLVQAGRKLGFHIMDRCNLTVLYEPGQEDLAGFLAENQVEIIASLPCYSFENVDKQRGNGVFESSIRALQQLNGLGYGQPGSGLDLNLVYNPVGAHLPPPQQNLEADYKRELFDHFGIVFNHLFTITNMPIKRYRNYLEISGQLESYQHLLLQSYNPQTLDNLMCRSLVSVDWLGQIYDCDFNQMLDLEIPGTDGRKLWDYNAQELIHRPIALGNHCYGCTAGAGSSCGGVLTDS